MRDEGWRRVVETAVKRDQGRKEKENNRGLESVPQPGLQGQRG